jgi:hypothetical protein
MLLINFVVEEGLFNGAVGTIVSICYEDDDRPGVNGFLPA